MIRNISIFIILFLVSISIAFSQEQPIQTNKGQPRKESAKKTTPCNIDPKRYHENSNIFFSLGTIVVSTNKESIPKNTAADNSYNRDSSHNPQNGWAFWTKDPIAVFTAVLIFCIECPNYLTLNGAERDSIKINIMNVGRTPAIIYDISSTVEIKQSDYPAKEKIDDKRTSLPTGMIIKSDSVETFVQSTAIQKKDVFSQTILCYGYVRYKDIFKNIHTTGFCYELSPHRNDGRFHISGNNDLNYCE